MSSTRLRQHAPLLILLYTALAAAWGWRLRSNEPAPPDEALQKTRTAIVRQIAKLPRHRMQPAIFQLGMLPEKDVLALGAWLEQPAVLRLRQITIQNGPVHTPSPVNNALLLSEIAKSGAPSVDEMRLLVAASGDRLEEPVKVEALVALAKEARKDNDDSLATDILLRACDSPAATWDTVLELAAASRAAHRPAAALRIVTLWLDNATNRLTAKQQPEALDLQSTLLIEGGRHAEASRIALDALRALPAKAAIPEAMLERALRTASAAGEVSELAPWIERHLRSMPEHASTWEQFVSGKTVGETYTRWLYHAASIADRQHESGGAADWFFRLAATGDLRVLGRLHTLTRQVGQEKDFQKLLDGLRQRPQDAFDSITLARALSAGGAPSAAHDLLVTHLKEHEDDRAAAFTLAEIDQTMRGSGSAAPIWEGFLKRFPGDVPALRRVTAIYLGAGQHTAALRALQQIPTAQLDEPTLRQIAALAEMLDDVPTALQARQWIVEQQSKPAAADLIALARLSPQHDDPSITGDLLRAIAAKQPASSFVSSLASAITREAQAAPFNAAEQVRSAIKVEE